MYGHGHADCYTRRRRGDSPRRSSRGDGNGVRRRIEPGESDMRSSLAQAIRSRPARPGHRLHPGREPRSSGTVYTNSDLHQPASAPPCSPDALARILPRYHRGRAIRRCSGREFNLVEYLPCRLGASGYGYSPLNSRSSHSSHQQVIRTTTITPSRSSIPPLPRMSRAVSWKRPSAGWKRPNTSGRARGSRTNPPNDACTGANLAQNAATP